MENKENKQDTAMKEEQVGEQGTNQQAGFIKRTINRCGLFFKKLFNKLIVDTGIKKIIVSCCLLLATLFKKIKTVFSKLYKIAISDGGIKKVLARSFSFIKELYRKTCALIQKFWKLAITDGGIKKTLLRFYSFIKALYHKTCVLLKHFWKVAITDGGLKKALNYSWLKIKTTKWTSTHCILWLAVLFLIVAFTWAKYAVLDEVTVGMGKVIPSKKVQIIQNLEGGIIKEVKINEGQLVEKGQALMVLDDIRFSSEYRSSAQQILRLRVEVARLMAEVNEKPFEPEPALVKQVPNYVKTERDLFNSRILERQQLEERYKLLQKEVDMTAPLVESGAVSEVELLRLRQGVNEVRGEISALRSSTLAQLNESRDELSKLQEGSPALKDRLERTVVRSPIRGIVKQIYVHTRGGTIQPGMDLMEIVPLDDSLLIEARIKPDDIGFIHPQQKAIIKVTAYDFSIYGGLEGEVEHISADTTVDEDDNSYYEVWVRTNKNYLMSRKENKKLPIIPGMQVSVDILTGNKTVLEYLLKPVIKAKHTALRER